MGGKELITCVESEEADPPARFQIEPLAPQHGFDAARLHIDAQPGTFLSSLGPEILTVVYASLPITDVGFGFAATATVCRGDQRVPIGFVSAATSVGKLFLETGLKSAGKLTPLLLARCLRRPALVGRILQTTLYPFMGGGAEDGPETASKAGQHRAELLSILVETHWRNRGVGARLLETLLDDCAARGIAHLDVTVDAANQGARRFYVRHGFVLQKTFRLYARDMCSYGRLVQR